MASAQVRARVVSTDRFARADFRLLRVHLGRATKAQGFFRSWPFSPRRSARQHPLPRAASSGSQGFPLGEVVSSGFGLAPGLSECVRLTESFKKPFPCARD